MNTTIRIEHLARVEGHGGVTVELDGKTVRSIRFDVFEGARLLEGLVKGRSYEDISPVLSRICAICSVAHALTSLKATENAFGIQVSHQTDVLRDLMFLGESIESHALHLFLLALPDYLKYPSAVAMAADHLEIVQLGLRLKRLGNSIQEVIGGRAVHPVNAVLGGFGRIPGAGHLIELRKDLLQAIEDGETAIGALSELPPADFCRAQPAFASLRSSNEYGYYAGDEVIMLANGSRATIPCSRYRLFTNECVVPHSHAKHSSYQGRPYMVGSLARLCINGTHLGARAAAAVGKLQLMIPSDNPADNNKAQAVELINDIDRAFNIVERLLSGGLTDEPPVEFRPRAGTGTAVTEAPRGLLIHSYTYDRDGRITYADVVTPTAINAASVENHLRLAAENVLSGEECEIRRALEMVVRAYDPCISCSVHLVRRSCET